MIAKKIGRQFILGKPNSSSSYVGKGRVSASVSHQEKKKNSWKKKKSEMKDQSNQVFSSSSSSFLLQFRQRLFFCRNKNSSSPFFPSLSGVIGFDTRRFFFLCFLGFFLLIFFPPPSKKKGKKNYLKLWTGRGNFWRVSLISYFTSHSLMSFEKDWDIQITQKNVGTCRAREREIWKREEGRFLLVCQCQVCV